MSVPLNLNRNVFPNIRVLCWAIAAGLLATWGAYLIFTMSHENGWSGALWMGSALGEFPALLCIFAMLSVKRSLHLSLGSNARSPTRRMTHDQYREVLRLRAESRNPLLEGLTVALLLAMIFIGWSTWGQEYWLLPQLGLSAMMVLVIAMREHPRRYLGDEEYYALIGSRDTQGHHRCVFCGGRGIYRHGEYGTTTCYSDCSKCGRNLYVS